MTKIVAENIGVQQKPDLLALIEAIKQDISKLSDTVSKKVSNSESNLEKKLIKDIKDIIKKENVDNIEQIATKVSKKVSENKVSQFGAFSSAKSLVSHIVEEIGKTRQSTNEVQRTDIVAGTLSSGLGMAKKALKSTKKIVDEQEQLNKEFIQDVNKLDKVVSDSKKNKKSVQQLIEKIKNSTDDIEIERSVVELKKSLSSKSEKTLKETKKIKAESQSLGINIDRYNKESDDIKKSIKDFFITQKKKFSSLKTSIKSLAADTLDILSSAKGNIDDPNYVTNIMADKLQQGIGTVGKLIRPNLKNKTFSEKLNPLFGQSNNLTDDIVNIKEDVTNISEETTEISDNVTGLRRYVKNNLAGDIADELEARGFGKGKNGKDGEGKVGEKQEKSWLSSLFDFLKNWLYTKLIGGILKGFKWVGKKLLSSIKWIGSKMWKGIKFLGGKLISVSKWFIGKLKTGLIWVVAALKSGFGWLDKKTGGRMGRFFSKIWRGFSWIGNKIGNVGKWIGGKIGFIGKLLSSGFSKLGGLLGKLGKFLPAIGTALAGVAGKLGLGGLARGLGGVVGGATKLGAKIAAPLALAGTAYGLYSTAFNREERGKEASRLAGMSVGERVLDTAIDPIQWGKNIGTAGGLIYDTVNTNIDTRRMQNNAVDLSKKTNDNYSDFYSRFSPTLSESDAKTAAAHQSINMMVNGPIHGIRVNESISSYKDRRIADEMATIISTSNQLLDINRSSVKISRRADVDKIMNDLKRIPGMWDSLKQSGKNSRSSWTRDNALVTKGDDFYKVLLPQRIKVLEEFIINQKNNNQQSIPTDTKTPQQPQIEANRNSSTNKTSITVPKDLQPSPKNDSKVTQQVPKPELNISDIKKENNTITDKTKEIVSSEVASLSKMLKTIDTKLDTLSIQKPGPMIMPIADRSFNDSLAISRGA